MLESDGRRYARQVEELEREKQRCFQDGMATRSVAIRRIQAGLIAAIEQRIGFKQKLCNLIERQVHLLHCQAGQYELMIELRANGLPASEWTEELLQKNQLEFRQLHEQLAQASHQQAAWEADVLPTDSQTSHPVNFWLEQMAKAETLPTLPEATAPIAQVSPMDQRLTPRASEASYAT